MWEDERRNDAGNRRQVWLSDLNINLDYGFDGAFFMFGKYDLRKCHIAKRKIRNWRKRFIRVANEGRSSDFLRCASYKCSDSLRRNMIMTRMLLRKGVHFRSW